MLFNSLEFILFFPIVTLAYYIIPIKVRWIWLLICSYYFYMSWDAKYAILIGVSTLITYASGLLISISQTRCVRKTYVVLSFILNIGILIYFKYFTWLLESVSSLLGTGLSSGFDIVLPVGISFYTFQALSYTVDVYRKDVVAEKNLFKYALFVAFFPQLVAGPIERSKNLLSQVNELHIFDYDKARNGLLTMMWGYFCKIVIADRAAIIVNTVFDDYTSYAGLQIAIAAMLFSVEIYCDFMGYSLIALGAASVLGFQLMKNFEQPYLSTSIKEFWRRWHISLSSWFRDYLYIPLGGSRCSRPRKYINLLIVFGVSGLWHGAGWNYLFWGLLHGTYQIVGELFQPIRTKINLLLGRDSNDFSYKVYRAISTFVLVTIAWVFFRLENVIDGFAFLGRLFVPNILFNCGILLNEDIYCLGLNSFNFNLLMISLCLLFVVSIMQRKKENVLAIVTKQNVCVRYICYWAIILTIVFSLNLSTQEFIYFQF